MSPASPPPAVLSSSRNALTLSRGVLWSIRGVWLTVRSVLLCRFPCVFLLFSRIVDLVELGSRCCCESLGLAEISSGLQFVLYVPERFEKGRPIRITAEC